jgi:hypothetical protein
MKSYKRYLPAFRWSKTFELKVEPHSPAYMPIKFIQIFGGRNWSLSIVKNGNPTLHGTPEEDSRVRKEETS